VAERTPLIMYLQVCGCHVCCLAETDAELWSVDTVLPTLHWCSHYIKVITLKHAMPSHLNTIHGC
jgi:hypothetical protein